MKLKNYVIQFDMYGNAMYAFGDVYENPKFLDGTSVRTSTILEYNEQKGYIKTRNEVYLLDGKNDT